MRRLLSWAIALWHWFGRRSINLLCFLFGCLVTAIVMVFVFSSISSTPRPKVQSTPVAQSTPPTQAGPTVKAAPIDESPLAAAAALMNDISGSLRMSPSQRAAYLKSRIVPGANYANTISALDISSAKQAAALGLQPGDDNTQTSYTYNTALDTALVGQPTSDGRYTVKMVSVELVGSIDCRRALDSRAITNVVIQKTPTGWMYVSSSVPFQPQVILRTEDKLNGSCFASLVDEFRKEVK